MSGIFITMEGPDGSGKSTQIELLKDYLSEKGYDIIVTREPGGTQISEKIRQIILDKENEKMSDMTELMLYVAARAQLVDEVIKPALDKNQVVISDRFVDSSAVYQGIARGLGTKLVYEMNQYAISRMPDITFLLDLDAKEGIKRKKHQAALDRLELEKLSFHEKVVEGYRSLAQEQDRIVLIDATLPKETIFERIISVLQERKIMK
ncbi:MAG: dTMP kinase [Lachnospiraceae bacterium]|nr:dTMP kinase [Lachnospiraceae bacterium]MEE1341656.1 dTMP kinase [Lachnospiraceae bacterium]